jgi:hypothetical protein
MYQMDMGYRKNNIVGLGKPPEPVRSEGNPNLSRRCALVCPRVEGGRKDPPIRPCGYDKGTISRYAEWIDNLVPNP